jgi:hypothetical protein
LAAVIGERVFLTCSVFGMGGAGGLWGASLGPLFGGGGAGGRPAAAGADAGGAAAAGAGEPKLTTA